jgi:hypothetical protein
VAAQTKREGGDGNREGERGVRVRAGGVEWGGKTRDGGWWEGIPQNVVRGIFVKQHITEFSLLCIGKNFNTRVQVKLFERGRCAGWTFYFVS